jgi:transcriptional regulator NrdR family protein
MKCPACGGREYRRHRIPVEVSNVIYRRHECLNWRCGTIFISMQQALSEEMVEVLAEAFEIATTQTSSSEETQSD